MRDSEADGMYCKAVHGSLRVRYIRHSVLGMEAGCDGAIIARPKQLRGAWLRFLNLLLN